MKCYGIRLTVVPTWSIIILVVHAIVNFSRFPLLSPRPIELDDNIKKKNGFDDRTVKLTVSLFKYKMCLKSINLYTLCCTSMWGVDWCFANVYKFKTSA